jgi:transcriptional regulator with XRE-family HTH domain
MVTLELGNRTPQSIDIPNIKSQVNPYDNGVETPYFGCPLKEAPAMNSFGDRLRKYRAAAGLTQEQLGFAIGVTKSSVSAWENNRETPSFRMLGDLSEALSQSLDALIRGDSNRSADSPKPGLQATTKDEEALLARFRKLPSKKRDAVLELLKP